MPRGPGKAVVVVGHSVIAEGLFRLLGDDPGFETARVVGCADGVVDRIIAKGPDVILIDAGCPEWQRHRLRLLDGVFQGQWNLTVVCVGQEGPEVEFYHKRSCTFQDVSQFLKALKQDR